MDLFETLRANETTASWLAELEALGEPASALELPPPHELPPLLLKLSVPHGDIDECVAALAALRREPRAWWLLQRSVDALERELGQAGSELAMPQLPEQLGAMARSFWICVYLALLPRIREYHSERGIPDDVSWFTLADLGRHMSIHRLKFGTLGLEVPWWIRLHFRGALYELGRLQFEMTTLGNRTGLAVRAAGLPYGPGDPVLSVHIPAYYGPMSPAACDASFARAKPFFERHFPERRYAVAVCHSWLLDEQLAEYLPPDSNIVSFMRRFRPAYRPDDNDDGTLEFVFRRTTHSLDELPQRTTLERAIVAHIRAGRHWHGGNGWLVLPGSPGMNARAEETQPAEAG